MDVKKNARFRELLNKPGIIASPACYDVLSARIAEQAGFELIGMGGNGAMASLIGYPDIEIATQTEMIGRARLMAARINIPMWADADTGYGSVNSLRRTILDYEAAGVSAIHLEDQVSPKRCGAIDGVTLIDADLMVEKIKFAVKVRKDPNFVIIGRTDSLSTHMGVDEAIRRCKIYADAGADVVMPENMTNLSNLQKVGRALSDRCPVLCDLFDKDVLKLTDDEIYNMGFKIVVRSMHTILSVAKLLKDIMTYWHENGTVGDYADQYLNIRELEKIVGLPEEFALRDVYKF